MLEWDPIDLATAELRSLSLFRNGSKAGSIPRPLEITATKISGLAVDTEYVFHLVLRTSAGQYSSEKLAVRTHKMTDLSGITVTPGVLPAPLRESLSGAVERIGAKMADSVRIDTTHFVCTEGRGREWEKALDMNIPVVRPEWIEGCEREGRIVGVRGYYLNADPRLRQVGQGVTQQRSPNAQRAPNPPRETAESQPGSQRTFPIPESRSDLALKPAPMSPQPPPAPGANLNSEGPAPTPPAKDTPHALHTSTTSVSEDDAEDVGYRSPALEPASKTELSVPSPPTESEDGRQSPGDRNLVDVPL